MANTNFAIGLDLIIRRPDNSVMFSGTVDEDITAGFLAELTGFEIDETEAQQILDARRKEDSQNCKACLAALGPNEFYATYDTFENVIYRNPDGTLECKHYKNP